MEPGRSLLLWRLINDRHGIFHCVFNASKRFCLWNFFWRVCTSSRRCFRVHMLWMAKARRKKSVQTGKLSPVNTKYNINRRDFTNGEVGVVGDKLDCDAVGEVTTEDGFESFPFSFWPNVCENMPPFLSMGGGDVWMGETTTSQYASQQTDSTYSSVVQQDLV